MKIVDIIKYEGDNSTFVWKHPAENFNTMSQLIVHDTQEALFMMNGQALDLFGGGRYTLSTQNIPLLSKVINIPTGGESPFHCEVYFINKTEQMAIKWGTDSQIQFMEPTYQFPISIGANGEMSLKVADSRKLLLKLVGTENDLSQATLVRYFRAFLMTKVKSYIARIIREQKISIFEIDERLDDFSKTLHEMLIPDFLEYGVTLERFFVTMIAKPESDPIYQQFRELHFRQYADIKKAEIEKQTTVIEAEGQAQKTVIESQARATSRQQEGYTYQQEQGFKVAQAAASNEGAAGQMTGLGIGLGSMTAVGGAVGGVLGGAIGGAMGTVQQGPQNPQNVADAPQNDIVNAPQQQAPAQEAAPVQEAQAPTEAAPQKDSMASFKERLEKLNMMKEAGILSEEELKAAKDKLLSEIL